VSYMLIPFFTQLTDEERHYGYFHQDNLVAHAANKSMATICEVFENRIISKGLCPPRTRDPSYCDHYLWGNLKGKGVQE
jgi:hypothetical protein